MSELTGSQSGVQRIKFLRQQKGLTQEEMHLSDVLTQANYSRIENGKSHPSRKKLDAILDRLEASFNDRQQIVKYFGYVPPYDLPNSEEIEATKIRCQPVLDSVPMPAYLMDFATHFLASNDCFAKLLGVHEDSGVLAELQNMPLFKAQFDSHVRMADHMEDMEKFLLIEMENIRQRLVPYQDERWYKGFVASLCEDEEFRHYWEATDGVKQRHSHVSAFAERVLQPVRFNISGFDTQMHFYANVDPLHGDDRFSIVYLISADAFTLRQISRWVES